MPAFLRRLPARVGGLFLCVGLACSTSSGGGPGGGGAGGLGAAGGAGGAGGVGGTGMMPAALTAGLWEGEYAGLRVCFFVQRDGLALTPSTDCNLARPSAPVASSYDLEVDAIGRDENGAPCSFTLTAALEVPIDPDTEAFGASLTEPSTGADLTFSGQLDGVLASGVASRSIDGSTCTVGWSAVSAAPPVSDVCGGELGSCCDRLFSCCRAILVSPVFFESCQGVVDQGNEIQCLAVLLGYPRCFELDL